MGARKGEIGWRRVDEEGDRLRICAEPSGDEWRFYSQLRRNDRWEEIKNPPLEDWLELLDGVRRRVSRKLMQPKAEKTLVRKIRERFPEAEIE
ncbi:MAG: hypothetical protein CMO80_09170 [Verrucomicrobiales bacterium]|nr:hypothetical protein [Verrucomicrobiales bacterium]|tara:strand:+ start:2558 stop:2836 length:279 start_codon:yes stop_codon:yes gene_type:complete